MKPTCLSRVWYSWCIILSLHHSLSLLDFRVFLLYSSVARFLLSIERFFGLQLFILSFRESISVNVVDSLSFLLRIDVSAFAAFVYHSHFLFGIYFSVLTATCLRVSI